MKSSQDRRQNSRQNGQRRTPVQFKQFETSGPGGKFKGVPKQIIEKYLQFARDYATSGDNVKAETCKQYAEHYLRLLSISQSQQPNPNPNQNRDQEDRQPEVRKRPKRTNKEKEPSEHTVIAIQDASKQPQPNVEEPANESRETVKNADSEEPPVKPKRRGRPPKAAAKPSEE